MDIFRFKSFSSYKNIKHGISTKEFGSMKDSNGRIDRENLNKFLSGLDIGPLAVCMEQLHGGNIAVVEDSSELLIKNVDGLITDKKNIPLAVITADCLPVLFFDQVKKVIGVAHAGRKGLEKEIIKNILQKFKTEFGSNAQDILAGIGPGIEKKCYEVDSILVDIAQIAIKHLINEGILIGNRENIEN